MPPHVLPDLKRNEPAVIPAVQSPACVLEQIFTSPLYSQQSVALGRSQRMERKKIYF